MEEKPPTQAGRDADRVRNARTPFSAPEQGQSEPVQSESGQSEQRRPEQGQAGQKRTTRRAGKAAPAVTFQPPAGDAAPAGTAKSEPSAPPAKPPAAGTPAAGTPRTGTPGAGTPGAGTPGAGTPAPRKAARAKPAAPKQPAKAAKTQPAPAQKAQPAPAQPAPAQPTSAQPTSAQPTSAQPAERRPATGQPAERRPATGQPAKAQPAQGQPGRAQATTAQPAKVVVHPTEVTPAKAQPAGAVQAKPEPTSPQVAPVVAQPATAEVQAAAVEDRPAKAQPAAARKQPVARKAPAKAARPPKPATQQPSAPQSVAKNTAALTRTDESHTHPAPEPPRTDPWTKLVADPGHAPELLALAAVRTIGPRAKEWARRTREAYPAATADGLARLAVAEKVRFGAVSSAAAAAAGSYTPVTLLAANAFTYAELILHVAAAYGLDPADEQRAVELLVLTQVHAGPEDAATALAGARTPAYEDDTSFTDAVWRLGRMAAAQTVAWTAVRVVNRVFPGTTLLAAAMTSRNGTRTVGTRATRFYSQLSQDSGSSV